MNRLFKKVVSFVLATAMMVGSFTVANVSSVFAAASGGGTYTWTLADDANFKNFAYDSKGTTSATSGDLTFYAKSANDVFVDTYLKMGGQGTSDGRRFELLNCAVNDEITIKYTSTSKRNISYVDGDDTGSSGDLNATGTTLGTTTAETKYTVKNNGTLKFYVSNNNFGIVSIKRVTPETSSVTTNVTLNVTDTATGTALSNFTVSDSEGNAVSPVEGKYPLYLNATYSVSADNYVTASVIPTAETASVSLTPIYNVTITGAPDGYTVEKADGTAVTANTDSTYTLTYGENYVVKCAGYGNVEFTCAGTTQAVSMQAQVDVDLSVTDGTDAITDYTVANSDGTEVAGTSGVYPLIPGETYTVSATGYVPTTFTAVSTETAKTITMESRYFTTSTEIPMTNLAEQVTDTAGAIKGQKIYDGKLAYVVNDAAYKVTAGNEYTIGDKTFASTAIGIHKVKTVSTNNVPTSGYFELYLKTGTTVNVYAYNHGGSERNFSVYSASSKTSTSVVNSTAKEAVYGTFEAPSDGVYYLTASNEFRVYEIDVVVPTPVTVTGTVTLEGVDTMPSNLVFTSGTTAINAPISENGTYSVTLVNGKSYDVTCDDSTLMATAGDTITVAQDTTTHNVTLATASEEDVTGEVIGLDNPSGVTITFTKGSTSTPATPDSTGKYTVSLLPGTYSVDVSSVDGYTASSLSTADFTVKQSSDSTAENWKNVLYTKAATPVTSEDVYVGYDGKDNNFATITEAMDAINVSSQSKYVVHIAKGTYQEQVIIAKDNVTFTNDDKGEVVIQWYYGIGYIYYSAGDDGYYSKAYAVDKHRKNAVSRWGSAVSVQAKNFLAEGITFKNTFNKEVTAEEKADGVEASTSSYTDTKITLDRTVDGFDATSYAATERAAAVAVEKNGSNAEFYNCKFYSTQDTLFMHNVTAYFNNCLISGQTDYIFGETEGRTTFDECTLEWAGYSDEKPVAGYITAIRGEYVFRDCKVTKSTSLNTVPGYYGRPWGTPTVVFINTETNGNIVDAGWMDWSSRLSSSKPYEYGNTSNGSAFVSILGTQLTETVAATYAATKDYNYFGDWLPVHHVAYVKDNETDDTEESDTVTVVWDFKNANTDLTTGGIQNTTGTVNVTVNNTVYTLDVDKTENATKSKLAQRTSDAQFNTGTIIKVPVKAGDKVTVVSFPNYHKFTVAGTAAEADTTVYEATADGTCDIVATEDSYLYSITLVTKKADASETTNYIKAIAAKTVAGDNTYTAYLFATVSADDVDNIEKVGFIIAPSEYDTADAMVAASSDDENGIITSDGSSTVYEEITYGKDATMKATDLNVGDYLTGLKITDISNSVNVYYTAYAVGKDGTKTYFNVGSVSANN